MGCRLSIGKQCSRREGMGLSRLRKSNENNWKVDESMSSMESGVPMSGRTRQAVFGEGFEDLRSNNSTWCMGIHTGDIHAEMGHYI